MHIFNSLIITSCVLVVSVTLSSCARLGPQQATKLPLPPVSQDPAKGDDHVLFKELQNKPLNTDKKEKSELIPGTDRFIPSLALAHKKAATATGAYNLNFDEADLGEMAKVVLGDILQQNYVLSPKVVGKVTLQTTKPLSKEELLPTLEMVLQMNNAALVKDGNIYHIEPAVDALYSADVVTSGGQAGGYQTKIIPIKNVPVQNIADILKPLVHDKTILNVDGARNILIASGTPDEMTRVLDMISTFDIDMLKGRSFGVFPLAYVEAETIITELEEVFNHKAGKSTAAGGVEAAGVSTGASGDFFRFIPIERMNAILAITHQARYLHDIEVWVDRLDKTNSASGSGVNVYKVQHSDAEDLAGTLNEIFNGTPKQDKAAKLAPGQNSASLTNKSSNTSVEKSNRKRSSTANHLGGSNSGGTAKVSNIEDVRIIADKANNALIIVATPSEYEVILPVIKQLDILPLQVLIDATIVSVDLKDDLQYGIAWYLTKNNSSLGGNLGEGVTLGNAARTATAAFATGGLSAVYNSGAINALLSAQASKNNLNVISSPSLMVLNNQEATIEVGDQIPIITSTLSGAGVSAGAGSTLVSTNQIQYKDTGVKLEVTPRVNANGMVIMEIKQSVSNPVKSTIGVTESAAISKKEINSSVAVLDGETIVLGGLIKEENTYNKGGIPFLHETPWLGALFGNTTNNKDRTELVVLITPRVVKNRQDATLISNEFRRKLTGIYAETPVIKK